MLRLVCLIICGHELGPLPPCSSLFCCCLAGSVPNSAMLYANLKASLRVSIATSVFCHTWQSRAASYLDPSHSAREMCLFCKLHMACDAGRAHSNMFLTKWSYTNAGLQLSVPAQQAKIFPSWVVPCICMLLTSISSPMVRLLNCNNFSPLLRNPIFSSYFQGGFILHLKVQVQFSIVADSNK